MSHETEADLLRRCRAGDGAAWEELFELHYQAAFRFVFQLAPDFTESDVEEICQDCFLTVIRNLDSFRGQSQFQTWLFRIAANKSRDYRDKTHAAKRGGGQVPLSLDADPVDNSPKLDLPSHANSPDAELMSAEQANQVQEALALLGDPCREIIELRYFGDLSYEEIAAELTLNPKTVSSRLSKCLDKLEELARPLFAREKFPPNPV